MIFNQHKTEPLKQIQHVSVSLREPVTLKSLKRRRSPMQRPRVWSGGVTKNK